MNIKSAIIKATVQLLAANTTVIRKETPAQEFFNTIFGTESEEQRVARKTEEVVDKTLAAVQKMNTNRKFKKIIQHV